MIKEFSSICTLLVILSSHRFTGSYKMKEITLKENSCMLPQGISTIRSPVSESPRMIPVKTGGLFVSASGLLSGLQGVLNDL